MSTANAGKPATRRRLVSVLVLTLFAAPVVEAVDLVEVANIVRTRHCGDASLPDQPLQANSQLDQAAAELANDAELSAAIAAAGYRAKSSASIRIRTPKGSNASVAKALAERLCNIVADAEYTDIGVYERGKEVWMVLANGGLLPEAGDQEFLSDILARLNEVRSQARRCGEREFPGAPPLRRSVELDDAARLHAWDIAERGVLSHTGSDGSDHSDRASRAGYHWQTIAENVAAGQRTADDVVNTWLESPGHCANLMDPKYSETGIAYALNPGDGRDIYWVQLYAEPK